MPSTTVNPLKDPLRTRTSDGLTKDFIHMTIDIYTERITAPANRTAPIVFLKPSADNSDLSTRILFGSAL